VKKKDFEFIAEDEDSARAYCLIVAQMGKKASYRYKDGKFIITVWKKNR
jgi:hypothetical protein